VKEQVAVGGKKGKPKAFSKRKGKIAKNKTVSQKK